MQVCLCHPFNSQSLKTFLDEAEKDSKPVRVLEAYRACSGAEKPNCGRCIPTVREAVDLHNEKIALLIPVKQIECPPQNPAPNPA